MTNPYAPPTAPVSDPEQPNVDELEYAGFWIRLGAWIIDSIIMLLITVPLLLLFVGSDALLSENRTTFAGIANFVLSYVFPAVWTITFWIVKDATPGKMLLSLRIVDASSGEKISSGQAIGRYFAYFLSAIVIFLGYLWIAFDDRNQGWHDKLAGTLVVRGR